MAKVTIIIPSYNHHDFLKERLDSILNQTYKDWEAIVIDDASTDKSSDFIEDYISNHPEFQIKHFIKNNENSGSGYSSWKKGIELAESEYIWIAETDDYSDKNFLFEMVTILDANKDCVITFCNSQYVDHRGAFLHDASKRLAHLNVAKGDYNFFKSNILLESMPLHSLITNGSCAVFRRPNMNLPEDLFIHSQISDIFLWTYLITNKTFAYSNSPLNFFRRHEMSTTTLNISNSNHKIYEEYCEYANFFLLGKNKSKQIVEHYTKHFLIPNRKLFGYFNKEPLRKLKSISTINKNLVLIRGYLQTILKRKS